MPHVLLPLQPDQVTAIQGYVSSGDYADGYNYVSGLLADANVNNDPAMTDAGRWFDIASQINGDSGFFGSFARGYLESEADAISVCVGPYFEVRKPWIECVNYAVMIRI